MDRMLSGQNVGRMLTLLYCVEKPISEQVVSGQFVGRMLSGRNVLVLYGLTKYD